MALFSHLTARSTVGLLAALVPLTLLTACGEEESSTATPGTDTSAAPTENPGQAYVAFAKAANAGDTKAFDEATVAEFHSDLTATDAASFAAATKSGDLVLPETVEEVSLRPGAELMKEFDLGEEWLEEVRSDTGLSDLTSDDVYVAQVADSSQGRDVDIVLLRDDADWRVWLIEDAE